MVLKGHLLFLLSGSVFDVENTNKVGSLATHQALEDLK